MSGFKVAVAGATGNVGHEMLSILAERQFPVSEVVALASPASIGREVSFGDKTLKCKALEHYDFSDTDICLMSAGGAVSKDYSPRIGAQGMRGHRQFVGLAPRPGRAADRARGQRGCGEGIRQEEHHRQPQLLDRATRGGAEAAARPRDDPAGGGGDLSVGLRRRQGSDGRIVRPDARGVRVRSGRAEESSPSESPSTSFRRSTCSWTTARPRKSGRWSPRPRKSSTPRSS